MRKQTSEVVAVDGVSLSVGSGEVVGLVGESGCGKSTLARCAIRLIEPTSGEIHFDGDNLLGMSARQLKEVRPKVQMVFQDPLASLNPRKTIRQAIGEGLLYHQIAKAGTEVEDAVVAVLEQVGLTADALNRYPHEFSGGQQQRICIGRAIALKPKLLVLDEAVSALDVSVQAQVLNLLIDLKRQLELSYLFISHDLSVIRHTCDRVVVLHFGQVVEEGPTEKLFKTPRHPYTKQLLGAIPIEHPSDRQKRR